MNNKNATAQGKTVLAIAVAAAVHANAQETAAPTTALPVDAQAAAVMEEVLVFGRFQQSLVDRIPIAPTELPFTLNVIDRDFLNERNFTRPIEALTTLPNITRTEDRQGTGTTNFISRGFEAPTLVDNRVQNNFRGAGARDDVFVERYEVLKGPASISTGPVGAGGIINTITRSPEAGRFTDFTLRVDEYGSIGGEFDTNLGELASGAVLLRIGGAYREFEFDARQTERQTIALRPVAIFNIGDATSIRASVAYTEHDVNPNSGFPLEEDGSIPRQIDTDTFTGYWNGEGDNEDILIDAELNHEFLDGLKLTMRGSNQDTSFDYANTAGLINYSGTPGVGPDDTDVFSLSQSAETESEATFFDAQLAFQTDAFGQQQDFVIGAAYDDRTFDRLFNSNAFEGPYSLDTLDEPRFGDGGSGPVEPFTINESELYSIFAEAAIRPSDRWTIVAGIRYDDLEQLTINFRGGDRLETPFDDDETTVRLGAAFEASDDLNLYASYAQAFVPQFGLRRSDNPVNAETSEGFEVGAKGSLWDGALTFQAGLFHTRRNDVALQDPNNGPLEFFVVSAGEVEVQGLEFSSVANPLPGLNITFNLGYTDIDVTEGDDEIQQPVFPDLTGSFYLNYTVQRGALDKLRLGAGLRYVDEREGPLVTFDSYTVTDINLAYPLTDQFSLQFDVLNVTDELYVENTSNNTVNRLVGSAVLGPPRTAVLTMRYSL